MPSGSNRYPDWRSNDLRSGQIVGGKGKMDRGDESSVAPGAEKHLTAPPPRVGSVFFALKPDASAAAATDRAGRLR